MKAIVIGASSGLGLELAKQLAANKCHVACIARREDRLNELRTQFPEQIRTYKHDVKNYAEVETLFPKICKELDGLDLVIYCAGYMAPVTPNEFSTTKDLEMIDVNLKGAIAWLNEAAIRFQGTRSGTIIAIGSVAGDRGRQAQPAYNTSKAAIATYAESLRNRLSSSGVKVITVKPGPMDTEMTHGLGLSNMMSAKSAANKILGLIGKNGEFYLSPVHKAIFYIIKRIPSPVFRKLKI